MAHSPTPSTERALTPATNAPELSVSELANALKRTVEDRFGHVRVRGEISNYRGPHSSGHCYFCLKDQNARLDAVIWKSTFSRLRTRPEEGLEVIATGRITTFPGKSSYQIVIEALEPAGVGALMALLDERRKKLAAEGLFDAERKKPLPFLPSVIGVVTSPTGAVIRDILHRLNDRFPRRVLLWPVRVQGEGSAQEVAAAIAGFNSLAPGGPIPRPDVLIVARGGGSLEDLWAFNEEVVVRAAAASAIPLIAAIGHETDVTLIDFAADLRAPTPTAAAEKCVPVRAELIERVSIATRRLRGAERRLLDHQCHRVTNLARLLQSPEKLLSDPRQRADRAGERLRSALRRSADARRLRISRLSHLLARHSPQAELARTSERISGLAARLRQALVARRTLALHRQEGDVRRLQHAEERLRRAFQGFVSQRRERISQLEKLRASLSHKAVLARGYALVRDASDALVRRARDVAAGQKLAIEFADGKVSVQAEAKDAAAKPAPAAERGRKTRGSSGQGSLF
jgi:exodeoxyribonuclease VII large subunit